MERAYLTNALYALLLVPGSFEAVLAAHNSLQTVAKYLPVWTLPNGIDAPAYGSMHQFSASRVIFATITP